MNAPERVFLTDVQARPDHRDVVIDRVGIKGLRLPIRLETPHGVQATIAEIELTVELASGVKGTHMSRFVELMDAWQRPLAPQHLPDLMSAMLRRLDAVHGRIEFRFPYFIRKSAPASGVSSLLDYQARMSVKAGQQGLEIRLSLTAPVTSLCPCSKEISAYGAHNQRSHVTLETMIAPQSGIDLDALAAIAEAAASCEVYGLLKRADEKYVTERAYDNPKFVEDLVRDLALSLDARPDILAYRVEAENFESIHNHSAYARLSRVKA